MHSLRRIGMAVLVVAPIAAVFVYRQWINRTYPQWEGVITAAIFVLSFESWVAQLYYYRNERFYLWINRQLLRFRKTHTHWQFAITYTGTRSFFANGPCTLPAIQEQIVSIFHTIYSGKPLNCVHLANSMQVTVDQGDRFTIDFDVESDRVFVSSSKLLVPSHQYELTLTTLTRLFDRLDQIVRPRQRAYGMSISFQSNPYFGFFVRHVPKRLLDEFRCSFKSTLHSGARVQATKDAILLDCASNVTLHEIARQYLTLSRTLITSEAAA